MALTLVYDCPHCGTKMAGFRHITSAQIPRQNTNWRLTFMCNTCGECVIAGAHSIQHDPIQTIAGNFADSYNFSGIVYPGPKKIDIPNHLPPAIADAFEKGCKRVKDDPNGACFQFRRAIELGLKDLSPEIDAWKLEKRIDKMAAQGKLTNEIKDWTHELRTIGNDAAHGDETFTEDEAEETMELARHILMYIFTLPKQVEEIRERNKPKPA